MGAFDFSSLNEAVWDKSRAKRKDSFAGGSDEIGQGEGFRGPTRPTGGRTQGLLLDAEPASLQKVQGSVGAQALGPKILLDSDSEVVWA